MREPDDIHATEESLPPELERQLQALYRPPQPVPPSVDDALLAAARAHLATPAPRARVVLWPRWLAAAAALTLLASLGFFWHAHHASPTPVAADLNHDGRVDILDAFALARRLHQQPTTGTLPDINGDGVVDQKDVDALAAEAVRLGKGKS